MAKIRSPIISVLGHVDHGKTSLLDRVRGTAVARAEPGQITQHISASYVPLDVIKNLCGHSLKKMNIRLTIPGLLFIDSPGHEAFSTLRKRGGSIADIAILVVDMGEGFRPQTDESLGFLKQFKTPFVVAATKIDRLLGWNPQANACFLDTMKEQTDRISAELDGKIYRLAGELEMRGFTAERFDRVSDFSRQVAIVPVSNVTGEGISDLLMVLAGITQKFMSKNLEITPGEGKGTILEVKEYKGLGMTIDIILYDGEICKSDWLVIGGEEIIKTKVKALLEPKALRELREGKDFRQVGSTHAAAGVKIAAPDLEKAIAGMPVRAVRDQKDIGRAIKEVEQEREEVEIETKGDGALLKADTLGSLEALVKSFKDKVSIRKAKVGTVTKADVMEMKAVKKPMIFSFGLKVPPDVAALAKDNNVQLFSSDVIYTLIEDHEKWAEDSKKRWKERLLAKTSRPGRVKALKGYVFRQSKPAIFGVEVLKGTIKPGSRLEKNGKIVGAVKEIQSQGENLEEVRMGGRAALCMPDVTIGKHVSEGDVLDVFLSNEDRENLGKVRDKLRPDELDLLDEGREGAGRNK
jgi:translation initiation factor 5B